MLKIRACWRLTEPDSSTISHAGCRPRIAGGGRTTARRGDEADGGEIHELGWLRPAGAIDARNAGEIELAPPQFITLEHLRPFVTAAEALAFYASRRPEHFATSFAGVEGGMVAMYEGDAAYGTDDVDVEGPRHRLWMVESGWRYERTDPEG